jgi:hypothetical protein
MPPPSAPRAWRRHGTATRGAQPARPPKATPPAAGPPPSKPPTWTRPQYADTARCGFLEGDGPEGLGPLRYIALIHSADPGRGRGVFALLLPATGRGLLVVVQPSALAAREVTPAALERAWRDGMGVLAPQGHNTQEQVEALGRVEWAVDYCSDGIEAARTLQRAILSARGRRGGGRVWRVCGPRQRAPRGFVAGWTGPRRTQWTRAGAAGALRAPCPSLS